MPVTAAMLNDLQEGRVSAFGDAIKGVMNEKRDDLIAEGKKFVAQSIVEASCPNKKGMNEEMHDDEKQMDEGKYGKKMNEEGDEKSSEESEGEGDEYEDEEEGM